MPTVRPIFKIIEFMCVSHLFCMFMPKKDIHYPMYGVRQPYLPHGVIVRGARLEDSDAILDMSRRADIFISLYRYISIPFHLKR